MALSREAAPWRLTGLEGRITLVHGGLDDQAVWSDRLYGFAPEAIAHIGWMGVGNFDRNNSAQAKNIGWTTDLLELGVRNGARVFVGIGSQAEYGSHANDDHTEAPTTVYGEAKLAAGRMAAQLAKHLDVRFAWLRIFSTYGPTDHAYWMIPGLIRDLLARRKPALTGGEQYWDFLHVEDAACAIFAVLTNASAHGIYQLGSGQALLLRTTIEILRDAIDPTLPLGFGEIAYRSDQVMHLEADTSRLVELGWKPKIALRHGLAETVQWYRANEWIFEKA